MRPLTYAHDLWDIATSPAGLVAMLIAGLWLSRQLASQPHRMDRWRLALLGTYVAAILVVTLQPLGEHIYGAVTLTSGLRDFDGSFNPIGAVKNVALFVPLGVIFESTQVSGGGRFRRVMLGVLALSVSIETLQFLFVPGRAADLSDLVSNVVGFAIGFGSQHRLRTHLWASKAD